MLLRPEYGSHLKNPVINAYHGLFIKLRALAKLRLFVEIIKAEYIGTALRSPGHYLGCVNLRKSLAVKEIPKASYEPFLYPELRPFPHVPQRHRAHGQPCLQRSMHFILVHGNRQHLIWL